MRLAWVNAPRLPRPPLWALGVVGLWGALVLLSLVLEQGLGKAFETCLLHRLTGRPCPSCGSTRALVALARGDLAGGLAWNPLIASGLILGTGLLLLRLFTGRTPRLELRPGERRALLVAGLLLLAANWVWVFKHVP